MAGAVAALLVVAACGDGGSGPGPRPQPPQPAAVAPVSPTQSTSPVASTVQARVKVTDASGAPLSGVTVAFSVVSGGGSAGAAAPTNATGETAATWTLGTRAGENRLRASVGSLAPVEFTATGTPGPAAALSVRVQPEGARVGAPLATQPVVEVQDAHGNLVAASVQVTASVSVGTLAGTASGTTTGGVAAFTDLVLTGAVGTRQLTFASPGLTSAFATVLLLPPPRSGTDRADEIVGAQVRVLYVIPSDGEDRGFDTTTHIAYTVASFQRWLAGQTGGRAFRMDTYAGVLDVGFFRLSRTNAEVKSQGAFVRNEIERQLSVAGLISTGKVYLVYYDGGSTYSCGGASWPPSVPGRVAAMYLHGTPPGASCGENTFVTAPDAFPRYWEFAAVHDLIHTLGIVSRAAPHHTAAYPAHVPEPEDLMYAGTAPWVIGPSTVVDVGRDDYFGPALPATLPTLDKSPYLASVPASFWSASLQSAVAQQGAPVQAAGLPPHPPFPGAP
ncbi:MAG TPA: hypothetical protein VGC13_24765 [Longimicrobium sp.]|uniref:hypothetical protein n=1 Tax=Longimicrobium sp. TaxID=2029185 RepID=UPI002EDAC9B8